MSQRPIPAVVNIGRDVSSNPRDFAKFGPRTSRMPLLREGSRSGYDTGADLLRAGQFGLAARQLRRSLILEGEQAKTYNALGAAYANLQRPDLAEQYFIRSVEIDPQSRSSRFNLALFLMRQGRNDAAEFHLARRGGSACLEVPVFDMRSSIAIESPTSDLVSSCGVW